jgi:hypothetical protein
MPNALTAIATRAALLVALASPLGAQAGLVTGNWDPEFNAGPFTDLSWSVNAEFFVPDACIALGNGDHSIAGACTGTTVNQAFLTLFRTSNTLESGTENFAGSLLATGVRVLDGQVIGVATTLGATVLYPYVFAALDNNFALGFTLTGPSVVCVGCSIDGYDEVASNVTAPLEDLEQVLTTFNDNGTAKLVDANGRAIGVRLDGRGQVIGLTGTPVPEPGSLPLVLGALASAAWLRRRSAR